MRKRVRTVVPRTHSWMWRNVGSLALCWWGFWIHAGSSCPFLSFPDTLATWEATYSQGTDRTVQGKPTGIQHTGGCSVEIVAILPVFPSKVGGVSLLHPPVQATCCCYCCYRRGTIFWSPLDHLRAPFYFLGDLWSLKYLHTKCAIFSLVLFGIYVHTYI